MMEFWTETKPVARHSHRCDACYRPIEPGRQYANMAGKVHGYFFTTKQHAECRSAEVALATLKECWGGDDWVHLNDLEERDDLLWLQQEHPIVFERLKARYGHWLEDAA